MTLLAPPAGAACIAMGVDVVLEKGHGTPELQLRWPLRLNASRARPPAASETQLTLSGDWPRVVFEDVDNPAAGAPVRFFRDGVDGPTTAILFKPPRVRELHVLGNLTYGGRDLLSLCPAVATSAGASVGSAGEGSAWSGALGGAAHARRFSPHADAALQFAISPGVGDGALQGAEIVWEDSADDGERVALVTGADGILHLFANKLVVNGVGCEGPMEGPGAGM